MSDELLVQKDAVNKALMPKATAKQLTDCLAAAFRRDCFVDVWAPMRADLRARLLKLLPPSVSDPGTSDFLRCLLTLLQGQHVIRSSHAERIGVDWTGAAVELLPAGAHAVQLSASRRHTGTAEHAERMPTVVVQFSGGQKEVPVQYLTPAVPGTLDVPFPVIDWHDPKCGIILMFIATAMESAPTPEIRALASDCCRLLMPLARTLPSDITRSLMVGSAFLRCCNFPPFPLAHLFFFSLSVKLGLSKAAETPREMVPEVLSALTAAVSLPVVALMPLYVTFVPPQSVSGSRPLPLPLFAPVLLPCGQ